MNKQENMFQTKEQDKCLSTNFNEMEICNLTQREFKQPLKFDQ